MKVPPLFKNMYCDNIIETKITTDLTVEPVTLNELKQHLNMLFDTIDSYVFTDDDTYLTSLIKAARQALEKYTGLSFGSKTITALINNSKGYTEIPFGPLISITSIKDADGDLIAPTTGYTLRGLDYKSIKSPWLDYMEVIYTAGFTVLPEDLKMAIKQLAASMYKWRGDDAEVKNSDWYRQAFELATPYKRTSFLQ